MQKKQQNQRKLSEGCLLDERGVLYEAGYATSLVKEYCRHCVRASRLRIKEWDYYCIIQDPMVLCLTIADNGYMSMDSVSVINVRTGEETTVSPIGLLPLGKRHLPSSSKQGDVSVSGKGYRISFENDGKTRVLKAHFDRFGGTTLDADIVLTDEPQDSMVIATPFANHPHCFYYNQKINNLKAEGRIRLGDETFTLSREKATAVLDWGRGVWTYENTWHWSSASGYTADGRSIGFNLGYGFGDTSAATENMLFVNGTAHKLGNVDFGIPQRNGRDDFMQAWHMTDDENRLDLQFTPLYNRKSCTNLGVLLSDQNQIFGLFSGYVITDSGEKIELDELLGFAEKVHNKW